MKKACGCPERGCYRWCPGLPGGGAVAATPARGRPGGAVFDSRERRARAAGLSGGTSQEAAPDPLFDRHGVIVPGKPIKQVVVDPVVAPVDRVKLGTANRRKGAEFERWLVGRLRDVFPEAARGIGQARAGGEIPDVKGCEPYWIEAKKGKVTNWRAALKQAVDYLAGQKSGTYRVPVAICRDDGKRPVVICYLDDWADLVQAAMRGGGVRSGE